MTSNLSCTRFILLLLVVTARCTLHRTSTMATDDPRLGSLIGKWHGAAAQVSEEASEAKEAKEKEVVLVGFESDIGVARNGGRVGAARGPAAMRRLVGKTGAVRNPEFQLHLGLYVLSSMARRCISPCLLVLTRVATVSAQIVDHFRCWRCERAGSRQQQRCAGACARGVDAVGVAHSAMRYAAAAADGAPRFWLASNACGVVGVVGGIPFVVGGGNDQSYPNAKALLNSSSVSYVPCIGCGLIRRQADRCA
jgi:hypothetical protein